MTAVQLTLAGRTYRLGQGVDLAVPLNCSGPQPNAFGVPPATAQAYAGPGFVLDTRQGGSCNCEVLTLIPHCHGTHTESVGHLTTDRFPLTAVLPEPFLPCTVVSLLPRGQELDAPLVEQVLAVRQPEFLTALVVRTVPNPVEKRTRRWEPATTPYFTPDAMHVIRDRGVQHLLVDLPSVDPLQDGGRLAAHRVFWELPPGSQQLPAEHARRRTITELIYVPDEVPDGRYLLTLQVPRLVSDAVPARPVLYFLDEGS
jgi:kynurenine formamidase